MSQPRTFETSSWRFTPKEMLYVITVLLSLSGLYYKLFFQQEQERVVRDKYERLTDQRLLSLEASQRLLCEQVRVLQDAELKRGERERIYQAFKK